MMQLEELRQQWQRVEEKIDRTLAIEDELVRQVVLSTTRGRINRGAIWPVLDVAFGLAVVLFSGSFLGDHHNTWSLAAPAGIVLVAATVYLVDSVYRLVQMARINWSETIVEIQTSLAQIRVGRLRQFKWVILFSPLVGFSALIVVVQWLLDRLPEQHFILNEVDPVWVAANFIFGVLFVPLGYLAIRFLAKRYRTRGWFQDFLDDLSGTSVRRAEQEVERWIHLTDTAPIEAS